MKYIRVNLTKYFFFYSHLYIAFLFAMVPSNISVFLESNIKEDVSLMYSDIYKKVL